MDLSNRNFTEGIYLAYVLTPSIRALSNSLDFEEFVSMDIDDRHGAREQLVAEWYLKHPSRRMP